MDERVKHGTIGNLSVYIVPTTFGPMRFINDPHYRDSDKQKGADRKGTVVRKARVHLTEVCKGKKHRD